ncbi:hypothetical protein [Pseudidiomarina gelatinasegens]|mgnify:CR=1 FL=1|uniref:hypothetical protein n=1 Tax=Pseudidiomarina gelatinasegens TaxID=2487740 RepID=UPI0030EE7399|tara:strand:- start:3175 stop:3741 length:567 start_codon:yes stop_codon:yes gene_type:complete
MNALISLAFLFVGLFMIPTANAEIMNVLIEKEINDDHIIIRTAKGDQLLLEKWTMKFSPLLFEGKTFPADVSSLWVEIYIEGKGKIKWSVEKHLGTAELSPTRNHNEKVSGVYPGVGSNHWIQKVSEGGKIIVLEDGSVWEVSPIDVIYSAIWIPTYNIVVIEDAGPHPYKLINTDDGESVNAKYLGQ